MVGVSFHPGLLLLLHCMSVRFCFFCCFFLFCFVLFFLFFCCCFFVVVVFFFFFFFFSLLFFFPLSLPLLCLESTAYLARLSVVVDLTSFHSRLLEII